MESSSTVPSDISTSTYAVSEESSTYSLNNLDPYFLADLKDCERCNVDQLLAVFLDRSRITAPDLSTPQIPQSMHPHPQEVPYSSMVPHGFLHLCLKEVTQFCKDPGLQERIREYQQAPKKNARYQPFVNIANYALKHLKSFKLSGLPEPSDLDILFLVNDSKRMKGLSQTQCVPDIVVVPLASTKRSLQVSEASWELCAGQHHPPDERDEFQWADVLIPTEMKWEHAILDFKPPETYSADLKNLEPLPTRDEPTLIIPTHGSVSFTRSGNSETASGACNHPKRPSDHLDQDNSEEPATEKTKVTDNHGIKAQRRAALVQSAINGAEMLRCSLGRRHAFGLVVIDAVMWLWWFDRQGAIQSTGIHFIEDLPRFLVFLLAIQRFALTDWGFDVELDPLITLRHFSKDPAPALIKLDIQNNLKVSFCTNVEMISQGAFCLKGRFTNAFRVTSDTEDLPLVAKLYWPNRNRVHEARLIDRARKVSPDLHNYLPRVFGSRDIDPIGTRRIREELGISSNSPRPSRVLRIIISERLLPITERTREDLIVAWLECMRCHIVLWNSGLRHQDVSLGNLMVRHSGDNYFGVINDWDLSFVEDESEPSVDITITIPFMALDLIPPPMARSLTVVDRLYYHDLESFIWTLLWIFLAVRDKKVEPNPVVARFRTSNAADSRKVRCDFLVYAEEYYPHDEWEEHWGMAMKVVNWLRSRYLRPDREETREKNIELLRTLLTAVDEAFIGTMPSEPAINIDRL